MRSWLIAIGLALVALGIVWPLLARLGLGRLPGDIWIRRPGFGLYIPITTSIVVSIVLSILFWILRK
jgi:Protein of unknown function (DUF2905)